MTYNMTVNSIVSATNLSPEIKMLSKFFKKQFPFVIEVSDYSVETSRSRQSLVLDIYVSPEHFCELMDVRVEKKVVKKMINISSQFIKSVITEWPETTTELNMRFFPEIKEATILKSLDEIVTEF